MKMITAFEPIWILTAVGYLAHRRGLLGENATAVLSRFVFHLAMPAALFLTLARTPLSRFDGKSLGAFAVSTAVATGLTWYGASRFFGRKDGERVIATMAGGYVNSANLGIPIALQNTFIFAQEYRAGEMVASRVVLLSTLFSLGTLAAIAALIGR
jgi:malonate transporter and related proteins